MIMIYYTTDFRFLLDLSPFIFISRQLHNSSEAWFWFITPQILGFYWTYPHLSSVIGVNVGSMILIYYTTDFRFLLDLSPFIFWFITPQILGFYWTYPHLSSIDYKLHYFLIAPFYATNAGVRAAYIIAFISVLIGVNGDTSVIFLIYVF